MSVSRSPDVHDEEPLTTTGTPTVSPLASVIDALRVIATDDEVPLALRFAELFLEEATAEFFMERTPDTVAALVLSAFRHLQRSAPERVDVTVSTPEQEPVPWSAPVTVIRTHVAEAPFIVDSIREYLHVRQLPVERFLHPVLQVVRAGDGAIVSIGPGSAGPPLESLVHCEVGRIDDAAIDSLRAELRSSLEDVAIVTTDFEPMMNALHAATASLDSAARRLPGREAEVREVREFLDWLRDNFVFLGYCETGSIGVPDARHGTTRIHLGLARQPAWSDRIRRATESQPPPPAAGAAPAAAGDGPRWPPRLLIVTQTDAESTVHRRERMHDITLRTVDPDDRILGERHFLGLFRERAFHEEAEHIPILRHKLELILERAGWREESHNHREAVKIFNSMPKDELFHASSVDIGRQIDVILAQYYTRQVKVTLRPDPTGRTVSVMVIMPRDRYSGRARRGILTELIRQLDASVLNTNLVMGGGEQARLHFQLAAPAERTRSLVAEQLEQRVRTLIQTWTDVLEMRLARSRSTDEARRQAQRWGAAFSPEYQAAVEPEQAVADIEAIESMEAAARMVDLRLSNREPAGGEPVTLLTVYMRGTRLVLSDVMPGLENAGLRVLSMSPFEARDDTGTTFIYVFAVQDAARQPIDLDARGAVLTEALLAVGAGEAANDSLNELVLHAGLAWREVDVLRLYCEYAFQLGLAPARLALTAALRAQPSAARLLVTMFARKFDPAVPDSPAERDAAVAGLCSEYTSALESVTSLAQDRALRNLLALLRATVRTNYFLHGGARPTRRSGGVPYISVKILNEHLQSIVSSRLRAEVWVQSARMAGVHLRGGPVSRGGLRHSDRPDDLRTEVLGLVRTQSVKNCVIVPAGSKGGFVTRRQPADPQQAAAEVVEQYRTLIRGLLDVTDNLTGAGVVRPESMVIHDGADPYLVVAADKGTARFSDVANEVAAEYGFWLGDAFASGGSNGYDHKGVGITARGAWMCVQRHFRELDLDIRTEPFTVAGIGDMSGDVFGNGMLLSPAIRLVAAFDHRNIFVDPTPDAARTYAERQRLFALGRSSWEDFNVTLLSEGGFIVPRGIKTIELSPPAAAALGVADHERRMDGETLVRTILRAPVDLLWNGGIGTYVKATAERHADAGDSANDPVRIDATELRCRVLGEGGNLGLTQRARVQFALNGGRCNTDAIDNSGGVDMSDREVNLKILLDAAVAEGRLDRDHRNALLHELTDAVTERVLHDNRSQSLAISLDEQRARDGFEDVHGFMVVLERNGVLDRAGESLPDLEDLRERQESALSLTRPELAVLLAYAKLALKPALVTGSVLDDPAMNGYLIDYFPAAAVEAAGPAALAGHRLRREIIATQLANEMIDLMGVTFVHRVMRDTGHTEADIARAWFVASRLSGAPELRAQLAVLEERLPSDVIYRWLLGLGRVLERTTRWILANVSGTTPVDDIIAQYLDGLRDLRGGFRAIVAGAARELFESRVAEARVLTERDDLAASIITLRFFDQLMEILTVAAATGSSAVRVGRSYYLASEVLGVSRLREAIFAAAGDSRWEQRVAQALDEDLGRAHRALTTAIVMEGHDDEPVDELLARVATRHATMLAGFRTLLDDVASDERPSLAALTIAVRELEALAW
ncbi:MAG TPA: NAD-glutamate dehydrogenase domain-containing protein [Longimicrobiales bacterium]